jgi:hypothetical protein
MNSGSSSPSFLVDLCSTQTTLQFILCPYTSENRTHRPFGSPATWITSIPDDPSHFTSCNYTSENRTHGSPATWTTSILGDPSHFTSCNYTSESWTTGPLDRPLLGSRQFQTTPPISHRVITRVHLAWTTGPLDRPLLGSRQFQTTPPISHRVITRVHLGPQALWIAQYLNPPPFTFRLRPSRLRTFCPQVACIVCNRPC